MKGFIQTYYDGVGYQFWISKKGYCYSQTENSKTKRISCAEYESAFEKHHNI